VAIGGLDRAGRLDQLETWAHLQVRSGYLSDEDVRTELYAAVLDEVREPGEAGRLTDSYLSRARADRAEAESSWPIPSGFDRLQAAFDDLREADVLVLEACDDHWAADEALRRATQAGRRPVGIAYFTQPDVWHAVEHGMLELNVWHGSTANIAADDELLELVQTVLGRHGIASRFDEGRIEVSVAWERRGR
jgi:hypothetical protein